MTSDEYLDTLVDGSTLLITCPVFVQELKTIMLVQMRSRTRAINSPFILEDVVVILIALLVLKKGFLLMIISEKCF
jgi:hypothetical protein